MVDRLVRTRLRLSIAISVVVLCFGVAFGGSYALALYALSQSQSVWCASLEILTKHPVKKPIPGHQAQVDNYDFYLSLVRIEHTYNCH